MCKLRGVGVFVALSMVLKGSLDEVGKQGQIEHVTWFLACYFFFGIFWLQIEILALIVAPQREGNQLGNKGTVK